MLPLTSLNNGNKTYYDYTPNGNLKSITDALGNETRYTYDALNRLTEVSRDESPLRKYAYDAFGNRTVKEDYSRQTVVQTAYRYNANNQLMGRSLVVEVGRYITTNETIAVYNKVVCGE